MTESKELFEFRKQLKFLKAQRGQGTELISVYIQPGANVAEVTNRLREEASQAGNIKSKQTRKNVQAAIERLLQALKGVHKPPENGTALFCGNIEGKIILFTLIPPQPVTVQLYRCDSTFFLDPFLEIIEPKEVYGLFVMDRREATIATLRGKQVEILDHMTSGVPGKHGKGGQSQVRMMRIIEQAAEAFFTKICERLNHYFKDPKIRGIIAGGPGPTKFEVLKSDKLFTDIKKKILGTVETGYTDETGIKEVIEKSGELVQQLEVQKERQIVQQFLRETATGGNACYGIGVVRQALQIRKVHILLLSEKAPDEILEELSQLAEQTNTTVEMISDSTPEGRQFLEGFGGIGAILRYK